MFYETIFETGNHSIAFYDSDEEAIRAIAEHHRRAKSGEPAQANDRAMGPAERIVKVLKYDRHPQDLTETNLASPSDVSQAVQAAIAKYSHGDLVSVNEVAAAVRDLTDPGVDSAPHDSNYKMEEVGVLTGWEGNDA
jgi:O6-methylguanine-DNA--protein-cysteine methyltransferase